jgi:glycosyltransferase involved in cell wall biosynthesis
MKVKVCFAIASVSFGGKEQVILNYAKHISADFELSVLIWENSKNDKIFENAGLKVFKYPTLKNIIKHKEFLKNFFETQKIDVLINNIVLYGTYISKYAHVNGVKVIQESHGTLQKGSSVLRTCFETIFRKTQNKYAYKFISVSEEAGKFLFGPKKFEIIHNPIDFTGLKYNPKLSKKIRAKYNISKNEIVIGTVGRMVKEKNLPFVLNLAKKLPDTKFVLVGYENVNSEFRKNVIFTGYQKNAKPFYSAFDIFILPSISEGMPLALIEAQSSGCKCLVSNNVTKFAKILDTCKYAPLKIDEWVKCLKNLMHDFDIANKSNNKIKDYNIVLKSQFNAINATKELEKLVLSCL